MTLEFDAVRRMWLPTHPSPVRRLLDRLERERDAAVARAEKLEQLLLQVAPDLVPPKP